MRRLILVAAAVAIAGCGKAAPTGPTGTPGTPGTTVPAPGVAPTPPTVDAADATIAAFSISGQLVQGIYRYRPRVTIQAGREPIVIRQIQFSMQGIELRSHRYVTTIPVAPGASYHFGSVEAGVEIEARAAATKAEVTVTYSHGGGSEHQVTGAAVVSPISGAPSQGTVEISRFTVSRWHDGYSWIYWPRLTLVEGSGLSDVTVTRLEFTLLDMGIHGRVPPFHRTWRVPAGGTISLFEQLFYGEPEFSLSSERWTSRVQVLVSYVDAEGRSGDVVGISTIAEAAGGR